MAISILLPRRLFFQSTVCFIGLFFVLSLGTACGSDDDSKKSNPECMTNGDCDEPQICDQSSRTCIDLAANNTNNSNNSNNTNNSNNQSAECGDGIVEGDETCDGDCPTATECTSEDACMVGTLTGSAATCDAACSFDPITACSDDDGCCPPGCDDTNDTDCAQELCGNGAVDGGETCDPGIPDASPGACVAPEMCQPSDVCMAATFSGSAATCDAQCDIAPITTCVDDDGCCPDSCDQSLDNDCAAPVGDTCTQDSDCQSGFCSLEETGNWPGGYCTSGCATDTDCPGPNAVCAGRICAASCTQASDCRSDYTCGDHFGTGQSICAPDATALSLGDPGDTCTSEDDCLGNFLSVGCAQPENGFDGGYCVAGCQIDSDCAAGSNCLVTEDGGFCAPECANDTECRSGYACYGYLGSPRDTCGPVASGSGSVGDACEVLQDCAGGQSGSCIQNPDFQDGYCTEACAVDSDCSSGSHCGFQGSDAPVCVKSCTPGDGTCRAGYDCLDPDEDGTNECFPSGLGTQTTGESCEGLYECTGGEDAVCIGEPSGWRDGYCSETCTADSDCETGAHCAFSDSGDGFCLKDCLNSADCRSDGYACSDPDEDGTDECFPGGTGSGAPGDSCAGVWECAGGSSGSCLTNAWPEGYCIVSGCVSDNDCATGSHCGFVDPDTGTGTCVDSCQADSDCRDSYGCFDLDRDANQECLPQGTRPVGSPCDGFGDCAGREDAVCATDAAGWPNGYCLLDCTTQGICPAQTTCVDFPAGQSLCTRECSTASDCRSGYRCISPGPGLPTVCLP